jgi:integrase
MRSANFRSAVWLPAVAELSSRYPELAGLRFHYLRHTAASLAISTGANIKAIQRMLGPKNASMTVDRYGHHYPEDLSDLAKRLAVPARLRSQLDQAWTRGGIVGISQWRTQ